MTSEEIDANIRFTLDAKFNNFMDQHRAIKLTLSSSALAEVDALSKRKYLQNLDHAAPPVKLTDE